MAPKGKEIVSMILLFDPLMMAAQKRSYIMKIHIFHTQKCAFLVAYALLKYAQQI
jgi:hypothetical protein